MLTNDIRKSFDLKSIKFQQPSVLFRGHVGPTRSGISDSILRQFKVVHLRTIPRLGTSSIDWVISYMRPNTDISRPHFSQYGKKYWNWEKILGIFTKNTGKNTGIFRYFWAYLLIKTLDFGAFCAVRAYNLGQKV